MKSANPCPARNVLDFDLRGIGKMKDKSLG